MKLNDPRITLIAGLALALNMNVSSSADAADSAGKKPRLLAQLPTDPVPSLSAPQTVPARVPSLFPSPTPPPPVPAGSPSTPPPPFDSPAIAPSPVPLNTQVTPAPTPRQPMGMFYQEQERLDSMVDPEFRPIPPNQVPAIPPSRLPVDTSPEGMGRPIVDRFGFAPPPGTLGQTYKRRSRLIEEKRHPRIGVVEVYLPENVDVSAVGLKVKWTGKVWRLESDSLLPGVPHIYEIKASYGEGTEPQYRTVRLIMGRVVDLEF